MVSSVLGLARLKGFWNRLGGGQRLVVGAVTFAGLGALVGFVTWPGSADGGAANGAQRAANEKSAAVPASGEDNEAWGLDAAWRAQSAADRDASGGSSAFMSLQRGLSEERTRLAQARLDQLWPGRTSVSVMVELDPAWEIRSERVLPADPVVRSEKISKDTSNDPGVAAGESGGGARRSETQDREFVTDVGERRSGRLAPAIKRLTVAVLYDRSLERSLGFRREDLAQAVKAIVGWDPQRDRPESFSTLVGEFAPVEGAWWTGLAVADFARQWGPAAGLVLGAVVVVLLLRVVWRRGAQKQRVVAPPVARESLSPDEQQASLRSEIERTMANDPAALAKLVESWLMEQKV